jgi:hypothetical protein
MDLKHLKNAWLNVVRSLAINNLSRVGVAITTSSLVSFAILEVSMMAGGLRNPYVGMITYLGIPSLFVLGLLLIPLSWWLEARRRKCSIKALLWENFDRRLLERRARGALAVRVLVVMTVLNVAFVTVMGLGAVRHMDEAEFCGTTCHSVMGPEWAVYQGSPHARVLCVHCHIGEGMGALIDAKLNGAWQMVAMTLGIYERPIPTPVHNLRPARYTCEKCHWPALFHGNQFRNVVHYQEDETSTPRHTTLMMKVGSGEPGQASGSHWHVASNNQVRYSSLDNEGETIVWVDMRQPDGSFRRFTNTKLTAEEAGRGGPEHVMDCVDCHNRATHVFELPASAVDTRIHQGLISRDLPFIKREALAALTREYPDREAALAGIASSIRDFYKQHYPALSASRSAAVDSAVAALQEIHRRNIHPDMRVTWGSYPNHLGHDDKTGGCFRCHNRDMVDVEGKAIRDDCVLCHSILANEEPEPYLYLFRPDEYAPRETREMQRYLRKEFWDYTRDAVQQGALPNQSAPTWFNQVAGQEGVGGALEGGGAEN